MPVAVPMLALMIVVQANGSSGAETPPARTPPPTSTSVAARRAVGAVLIDGKGDAGVWRGALAVMAFGEFSRRGAGAPRLPTEARVAYDDHNFCACIRAFDR